MSTIRPRRSVLYMPGSNARAMEKARTLPADALIFDLEDAVAPDVKDEARRLVVETVRAGGFGPREVVVRINGPTTPWAAADLEAVAAAGPDAILLPKVESAAEIVRVGQALDRAGVPDRVTIWVMIETPRAILAADAIAGAKCDPAGRRLAVYVMGTNDLAKETRARIVPGRAPMTAWLSQAVLAARANGLEIVDGVYNALKDIEGFRRECEEGRDLGMDGKTVIHPDQVTIANEVFAPSSAEVETARKIIAAFAGPEAAGKGALQIDGRMVERLHAEMAQRTVAIADAIAARN